MGRHLFQDGRVGAQANNNKQQQWKKKMKIKSGGGKMSNVQQFSFEISLNNQDVSLGIYNQEGEAERRSSEGTNSRIIIIRNKTPMAFVQGKVTTVLWFHSWCLDSCELFISLLLPFLLHIFTASTFSNWQKEKKSQTAESRPSQTRTRFCALTSCTLLVVTKRDKGKILVWDFFFFLECAQLCFCSFILTSSDKEKTDLCACVRAQL